MKAKRIVKYILGSIVGVGAVLSPYTFSSQQRAIVYTDIPHVFAGTNDSTSTPTVQAGDTSINTDLAIVLESFLKVIYVLLWPLLWIAGLAMDNSLVYGEIFGLDKALFSFWGIMKNFANFTLGFLFIWTIVQFLIKSDQKKVKDMVGKLLLASVGVQLSWFIMGALVDLSTVLTVGLGGLPLQLIGDTAVSNKPILSVKTSVKLNDSIGTQDNVVVLYTRPGSKFTKDGKYLLPCYITGGQIQWGDPWKQAFGVAGTSNTVKGTSNVARGTNTVDDYCIIGSQDAVSKTLYEQAGSPGFNTDAMRTVITSSAGAFQTYGQCDSNNICQTMKSFTEKATAYQGAFYTLYASLLNLSTIQVGVPKSDISMTMETLMKVIIAAAYLIPLAILCIVLIMRVGYLWIIIAFSPFIIIASASLPGLDGKGLKTVTDKFSIKNVISLLLLPVVVTFAISVSIVFLSALSQGLARDGTSTSMDIHQRAEGNYRCYDVAITDICLDIPTKDIGTGVFDYFSRVIMNLFGIGLMRFVVMGALKASEFTKEIAGKVQGFAEKALMSAPIIPLGSGRTNLSALANAPSMLKTDIEQANTKKQTIASEDLKVFVQKGLGEGQPGNSALSGIATRMAAQPGDLNVGTQGLVEAVRNPELTNPSNGNLLNFSDHGAAATQFANSLALSAGSKGFEKGSDLFETDDGRKVLAKLVNNSNGTIDVSNLRALYSRKSEDSAKRDKIESQIKAEIGKLPSATPKSTATKNIVTIGDKDYFIQGDKKKGYKLYGMKTGQSEKEADPLDISVANLGTLIDRANKSNKANVQKLIVEDGSDKKDLRQAIIGTKTTIGGKEKIVEEVGGQLVLKDNITTSTPSPTPNPIK